MTAPENMLPLTGADRLGDNSFEILRLWVEHGGGSVAWIASSVLTDPRAFGRLLADALEHGARAYATEGRDEQVARQAILDGFDRTMRDVAPAMIVPGADKGQPG